MTRKREHRQPLGISGILIRFVIPGVPLLSSAFLTWYGFVLLPKDPEASWPLIILSGIVALGSSLLIWYLNTARMRAEFQSYVISEDDASE